MPEPRNETTRVRQRILDLSVPMPNGCRQWIANRDDRGYGRLTVNGRTRRAHRVAYELWRGPIPEGKVLDHVACDNPSCVNPWHLLPATVRENTLRSARAPGAINARKTHCVRGHEFTPANTYQRLTGGRRCRKCSVETTKAYRDRKAAA